MKQFKTLYLIENTDYMYGVMNVCSLTKRAKLRYYICIEGDIYEFSDDDSFDAWKNNISRIVDKANEICEENKFNLWTY
jgi:hypothetical protein